MTNSYTNVRIIVLSLGIAVLASGCTRHGYVVPPTSSVYDWEIDKHECTMYSSTGNTARIPLGRNHVYAQMRNHNVIDSCMGKKGYTPTGWGWLWNKFTQRDAGARHARG